VGGQGDPVQCDCAADGAGPPKPSLAGEPEVAALALYLASGRGKALSGLVFEAEPAR
jgi:hypothetical protein